MDNNIKSQSNPKELSNRTNFYELYKNNPISNNEELMNIGLFINRQTLSRLLLINEIYKKIINTHGVIMEFGVRWGQNLALFENLRGMYEPYNYTRKIVGFDTFEGFPQVDKKDIYVNTNDYNVVPNYEEYLNQVLDYHESESPLSHMKKFEIVKGNAIEELPKYLSKHKETIIALAYFDFDIYEPTKVCLELIKDRLTKGSIIVFDELNHPLFPGETEAVMEVLGLRNHHLQRSVLSPNISYIVLD